MRQWDDCSGVWQSVWVAAVGCWPCLWANQAVALDCLAQGQGNTGLVTTVSTFHCQGTYCNTTGICVTGSVCIVRRCMYNGRCFWSVDAISASLCVTVSHVKTNCQTISIKSMHPCWCHRGWLIRCTVTCTSRGVPLVLSYDQTLLSGGIVRN